MVCYSITSHIQTELVESRADCPRIGVLIPQLVVIAGTTCLPRDHSGPWLAVSRLNFQHQTVQFTLDVEALRYIWWWWNLKKNNAHI